ncbi:OmpW/AlkL family protein [Paludibacterium yongneupense]|uniref:OmpW/AlkL family protein n=1 Tax=Paludibacterium yongneupense TaxID=400061 RepID=UPI0004113DE8|nr:OmpW family outer membrane protein [Paludibacterium yongneupense]
MKKLQLALVTGLFSAAAFAAQGDILARFRVIDVKPEVSSDKQLQTLGTTVNSDVVPELDFTYMITDHIGTELILGTSRHELNSSIGSLGSVSVLPPTLTLQWHFDAMGPFLPYVGAGINYTRFYNSGLHAGSQNVNIDKNSFGPALQIGTDYTISKKLFINVDVKKLYIKTKATLDDGTDLGTLKINPWVFGIGVGTTF